MTKTGFIYKIVSVDPKDVIVYYIGSTFNFRQRKSEHARGCNNNTKHKSLYTVLNEKGGWGSFKMEIIKEVKDLPDDVKLARPLLHRSERETIETMTAILNCKKPAPTEEEKDKIKHEYYIKKHSEETPEEREARLTRQKEYNKSYTRAPLTPEQKARKLEVDRESRRARQQLLNEKDREKRASETPEERESRLAKSKTDERREYKRLHAAKRREAKKNI